MPRSDGTLRLPACRRDKDPPLKQYFISIKFKLMLLFMVFSIIPMGFVATHLYRHAIAGIQSATIEHLEELAKLKADEINLYFDQVKIDIVSAQEFVVLRGNIPILSALSGHKDDPRYVAVKKMIDVQTIKYASDHHINDIDILSPAGTVIYSTDNDDTVHIESETHAVAALLREGRKGIYFTDVFHKLENGAPMDFMLASAPLSDLKGRFIGVIIYELNLNRFFEQIQTTTGLGRSGETLIVKLAGDSVRYLNPLRHASGTSLGQIITNEDKRSIPCHLAASGQTGSGITIDYRGVEVVAAWRHVPTVAWGIVTKTDSYEAFAPIIELRDDLLAAGAIAFSLGMIFSLWLAHSMSRPIRALQRGAEELGRGNLDYQVANTSHDEIGLLSRTFNQMVVNLQEMTDSRDQIRHQALHDPLTGLPNRMLLEDRMQQALIEARRDNEIAVVMFLDLDGFKEVNDLHGHEAGDDLLKKVSFRLQSCVRERDTVARLGGDEFVIILNQVKDINNISIITNKIFKVFEKNIDVFGVSMSVKTSIGVSLYPLHAANADELLQLADDAMYQAKRAGKNRCQIAGQVPEGTALDDNFGEMAAAWL
jgi:diguanylate cyclase (GGDEF)-like protein